MKIAYKCGLAEEEIAYINSRPDIENVEIQILSLNDNLEKIDTIKAKIVSIHYSLDKTSRTYACCNISHIIDIIREKDKELEYLNKIIGYCKKYEAGITIHADITFDKFKNTKGIKELVEFIKESDIIWHIENVAEEIRGKEKEGNEAPRKICGYINEEIGKEMCFPLLDICHYLMVREYIDSNLDMNLVETIKYFNSKCYYIHFNHRIGSGDGRTGGVHGSNFSTDLPMLEELVNIFKDKDVMLILEVRENDYNRRDNATWLDRKIREIANKKTERR